MDDGGGGHSMFKFGLLLGKERNFLAIKNLGWFVWDLLYLHCNL